MRRPTALILALLMVGVIATPAEAATAHRVFTSSVGTNGSSGRASITANTDGTGRVAYGLKGLKKGLTYRVEVRKGRCNNLGTVVTRLSGVKASAAGTVYTSRALSTSKMFPIWKANWTNRLAIRFVSGSSIRCGNLNFVTATRVRVPAQGVLNTDINLPIVRGPSGYPYCNVAMSMGALNQPTEPGVTFIFAHARKGMFLPLLNQWRYHNKGAKLIGMSVYVYTSNNRVHRYVIDRVRSSKTMDGVFGVQAERLWLQTSTGPNYTYPKLFIEGSRVSTSSTTYSAAHPRARIVKCG
ncbi:MAG TPA: hypothetical protein VES19_03040 [Candidatus Limnocylindrales bacterium]|nr:hypothetical protein [Candidatus Limnocylindrales bacterium]